MSSNKPAFVLIHGAWHAGHSWHKLVPLLREAGYKVHAPSLPGAGENAQSPDAFDQQPFDPMAFSTEPSPNAVVTQDERTAAIVDLVRQASEGGTRKVVLVGHSMGGVTISPVAEAVPELLHAVVYLTAFMLAPGLPAIAVIQDTKMAQALVPQLFMADPEQVGALRINVASGDPAYLQVLKSAFYEDVDDAEFGAFIKSLHCDEPVSVAVTPSPVSAAKFGTVPRHYIRCLEDRAITADGQNMMIESMDSAIGGKTMVHDLKSSHSAFLSQPEALAEILRGISG